MKIQIKCENCGKIIELSPETYGNICYVQSKLNNAEMYCNVDIETQVNTYIDNIKKLDNAADIDIESSLNYIRITCKDCGEYIELHDLT